MELDIIKVDHASRFGTLYTDREGPDLGKIRSQRDQVYVPLCPLLRPCWFRGILINHLGVINLHIEPTITGIVYRF